MMKCDNRLIDFLRSGHIRDMTELNKLIDDNDTFKFISSPLLVLVKFATLIFLRLYHDFSCYIPRILRL